MGKNSTQIIKFKINTEEKEMFNFLKTQGFSVSTIIKLILREKAIAHGYQSKQEG